MTTRIKLRRDTASNWTNVNPVLALAEPGVETDTNKMKVGDGTKTWSELQYIDGADVTRIKAGWIQSIGYIPNIANGEGEDFWFQSVAVDADSNSYYVGGNYNDDNPWTVKLDSEGNIVWQTGLNDFDGYAGEGQAVQIDPNNGEVVIVADMWGSVGAGGDAGMLLYRLNPTDGTLVGNPLRIRDDDSSNSVDIYPYDLMMDGSDAIILGYRNDDIFNVEVAKQTGSNAQKIIISTSVLETGAYPKAYNGWYVSGTDINGEGLVININEYTAAYGTNSGGGNDDASFNFNFYVYKGETSTGVTLNTGGLNYSINDVITIPAASCGGSVDAVITVTGVGGSGEVSTFTVTTYTPDTSKVMLTIDPNGGSVDFANSGTWNLIQYRNNSGFVYSEQGSGWTSIVGDSDNDAFYAGAIDSNSNVYAAGRTYDDTYGWDRNMLVKYNNAGVVQYRKSFDFVGSEGPDGYTGIAIDSENNVYLAGLINDFDNTGDTFNTITKVNSSGVMQWQKAFNTGSDPYEMWNMCLAVDSDDNVYLGAEYNSPDSLNDDFFFAKISSTGILQWQRMLKSFGDANAQWGNGLQSLKVKGDKFYYTASTEVYTSNGTSTTLSVCLPTDGTGLGVIGNTTWEYAEVDLAWNDTPNQQTTNLQVGAGTAVFTTDEPVTGSSPTTYTNAYLSVYKGNGGIVGAVKELTFEDGTTQKTASKNIIPQNIEGVLKGQNNLYLRLDHAGQFIRVTMRWGNQSIYVPVNADVPFEIGTVITIIADDLYDNGNSIYIYSNNGFRQPEITGVGTNSDSPADWYVLNSNTNNNKTGIYTLMKVDTDRWVLSGPDVQENWC